MEPAAATMLPEMEMLPPANIDPVVDNRKYRESVTALPRLKITTADQGKPWPRLKRGYRRRK